MLCKITVCRLVCSDCVVVVVVCYLLVKGVWHCPFIYLKNFRHVQTTEKFPNKQRTNERTNERINE